MYDLSRSQGKQQKNLDWKPGLTPPSMLQTTGTLPFVLLILAFPVKVMYQWARVITLCISLQICYLHIWEELPPTALPWLGGQVVAHSSSTMLQVGKHLKESWGRLSIEIKAWRKTLWGFQQTLQKGFWQRIGILECSTWSCFAFSRICHAFLWLRGNTY